MLWGGASADRTDARSFLLKVYAIAWLFPLALFGMTEIGLLNIWTVSLFGIVMSTAISFSSPAQQAILNRVVGIDVQRGVTAATAVGFTVQMLGLILAGQMEIVGVGNILLIQSASLVLGLLTMMKIAPLTVAQERNKSSTFDSMLDGFRASYKNKNIFHTLTILSLIHI